MNQRSLVVISAGLSQPSSTRLLADRLSAAAVDQAASLGVDLTVRVVELRDVAHDLMNHMLTGFPPAALKDVIEAVEAADGIIAVTPVFNASFSGLFKSFFDVLDKDALVDKPVLIAATGGTARHSLALEHALRPMFAYLRAVTMPTSVFAATDDWGGSEDLLHGRVDRAASELAREISRREPAVVTDPFALTTSFADMLGA
ncbi:NAD(P)H-dependent oxidoreductase [Winogradskya consettensis]|uniref:Oxidoreductase n=1 Tax=Winogradskya consettensis TaxID=113560 RepID=A0A919SUL9_9ACTN|nr:FMN reductase [Actinoplanes consettensis]GIM77702.1 oxidoreductase [Actinoplanes consettensis]